MACFSQSGTKILSRCAFKKKKTPSFSLAWGRMSLKQKKNSAEHSALHRRQVGYAGTCTKTRQERQLVAIIIKRSSLLTTANSNASHKTQRRKKLCYVFLLFPPPLLVAVAELFFVHVSKNGSQRGLEMQGRKEEKKKRVSSKAGLKDSPVTLKPIVTSLGYGRKATKKKEEKKKRVLQLENVH